MLNNIENFKVNDNKKRTIVWQEFIYKMVRNSSDQRLLWI